MLIAFCFVFFIPTLIRRHVLAKRRAWPSYIRVNLAFRCCCFLLCPVLVAVYCFFFLFAVVVFLTVVFIPGKFGIHPPYPHNQHVIEYTSVAVTCAAYDSNGIQKPERIDFVKQTDDPVTMHRNTIVLKEDGTIYFTNRTEGESFQVSNKASGWLFFMKVNFFNLERADLFQK